MIKYSPEREIPVEPLAPIMYTCLQASHLGQVCDLLARVFWSGINGTVDFTKLFFAVILMMMESPS